MSWNRVRDEPYRPGDHKSDPVERLFHQHAAGHRRVRGLVLLRGIAAAEPTADLSQRRWRRSASSPKRLSRKQKQAETREQLLEAAERVFLRRGLEGSSVEEISAEAGFTRGAFYSNFESKDQLFVELLHERIYRGYRRMLDRVEESGGTPRERLVRGAGCSATHRATRKAGGSSGSGSSV